MKGEHAIACGDVLAVLRELPDNEFDGLLCDPPYGLSFMGKRWDYDVPSVDVWRECMRVLKPGAPLIAFFGTRTYHRGVVAIEDAGFEIRDCLSWMYGCLSEDSEILTEHGWKLGVDVVAGEKVAAWDSTTGAIVLSDVEQTTVAPYRGELVRFANDDTDQLLTPNHRVYLQTLDREQVDGVRSASWSDWQVMQACDVNRWQSVRLPMAGLHEGEGVGGTDYAALLGWVWTEGGFDSTGTGVRIYQSPSANPEKTNGIDELTKRLVPESKRYDRERVYRYKETERDYSEACWFFSGEMARRVREDLPGKHPDWSLLWRMTLEEKQAFWDAAMKGDGSGHDFYQKHEKDLEWAQALLATMGLRGKIGMRRAPREGGAVCVTQRATTELQARHLRLSGEAYDGLVWCVKVATGAFVARRNGKVFITGNSGFPKSHDVSKAIDKAEGAEREAIGTAVYGDGHVQRSTKSIGFAGRDPTADTRAVTAPATAAARLWAGYGTALKPAWEPAVLARKPLEGTVAQNVAKWGVGGLAIDACRIEAHGRPLIESKSEPSVTAFGNGLNGSKAIGTTEIGRWPANVCLDEEAGAMLDAQAGNRPGMKSGGSGRRDASMFGVGGITKPETIRGDTGGASRFFYCAKVSTKEREHGCNALPMRTNAEMTDSAEGAARLESPRTGAGRGSGARNHHPTLKPIALTTWLARLILPPTPGATLLVPYSGAGSEIIGALRAGWSAVFGIEGEQDYVEIAHARIDAWRKGEP